jgi:hypothetical protein
MSAAESLPTPRYERTAGSPGLVVLSAAALVGGIAAVLIVSAWIARPHGTARAIAPELLFTHGPEEHTSIARDWTAQDAAVREHLETYGWNDRGTGIVRIPIDRAIELVSREAKDAPRKESP